MITCAKCGAQMPDGARFCSQCGEKLEGERGFRAGDVVWEDSDVIFTFHGVKTLGTGETVLIFAMKNKNYAATVPSRDIVPVLYHLEAQGEVLFRDCFFAGLPQDAEGLSQIGPGKEVRFFSNPRKMPEVKEFKLQLGYCVRGAESRSYNWGEQVNSPVLRILT